MELEAEEGLSQIPEDVDPGGLTRRVCALFYAVDVCVHTQALVFYKLWFICTVLGFQALFFLLYFSFYCPQFVISPQPVCVLSETRGPVGFSFRTYAPSVGFLGPALLPVPGHLLLIRRCRGVSATARKAPGRLTDTGISTGTA